MYSLHLNVNIQSLFLKITKNLKFEKMDLNSSWLMFRGNKLLYTEEAVWIKYSIQKTGLTRLIQAPLSYLSIFHEWLYKLIAWPSLHPLM